LLDESKRLREEAKAAASKPAQAPQQAAPAVTSAAPIAAAQAAQAVTPLAPASAAAAPALVFRSPEQRKLDAQRRMELAAQTRPFKKSLEQTEQRMTQLQKHKADLESKLATPMATNAIVQASKDLGAANAEMETLELKWLELSEHIAQIEGSGATA
jgi:ATP-binding cassette subfamily F protein 3